MGGRSVSAPAENPALDLKAPKVTLCPTLPFSREEMIRILEAVGQYTEEMPSHGIANGRRIRGLVLLLRYSGMRIGDTVNLSTDRIEGNRLFLYTQKTGVPVNTILPEFVLAALAATPKVTQKFLFWSGVGKLESIVRSAEKHYAPWGRSRQEHLEADLANAWSRDPLVLLQTEVHQRYTERADTTTHLSSIRKSGARGGGRTHTTRKRQGILSRSPRILQPPLFQSD